MDDPHEEETRLALQAEPVADENITAQDLAGYFVTFQQRMDEYKIDSAWALKAQYKAGWRSAIERIIPLESEASFAGFEAYLPATVSAAIYTWVSVGAYYESAGIGVLKRLSSEWRSRAFVADALARTAKRTLSAGVTQNQIDTFVSCYALVVQARSKPRLERILAFHSRLEALSEWRDEWDALEASYDDGDIDYDDYTLGKEELLARHP